jgi:hypothetical protein
MDKMTKVVDTLLKASDKFAYFYGITDYSKNRENAFEFIQFIGDYCVERIKEEVHDCYCLKCPDCRNAMDAHLKECHPLCRPEPMIVAVPHEFDDGYTVNIPALEDGKEVNIKKMDGRVYIEVKAWS